MIQIAVGSAPGHDGTGELGTDGAGEILEFALPQVAEEQWRLLELHLGLDPPDFLLDVSAGSQDVGISVGSTLMGVASPTEAISLRSPKML